MKINIKPAPVNAWKCTACNHYFTYYGPAHSQLMPHFCPNCGTPAVEDKKGEENVYRDDNN